MKTPALTVNNISKNFYVKTSLFSEKEVIQAVKSVSFELAENESLGLIGESGCGKSTTAQLILRLIEPCEGTITLFEKDITTLSQSAMRPIRKDLQIIFQQSKVVLDPKMTIEELLIEPLRIHKIVKRGHIDREIQRLLDLVGLSYEERFKFPTQLSGGQIQRIIIARAIATRAKVIICDEPVSALDVSVQGQILNLLVKLKKELNLSLLFISHDIKAIRHMCDRIAVMYKGEIVEIGTTADLINNPQHEHTRQLIESML
jgi:ABC-type glutathione transport system ATPase component